MNISRVGVSHVISERVRWHIKLMLLMRSSVEDRRRRRRWGGRGVRAVVGGQPRQQGQTVALGER